MVSMSKICQTVPTILAREVASMTLTEVLMLLNLLCSVILDFNVPKEITATQ